MSQDQARQFVDQATQSIQSGQFDQALQLVEQALAIDPALVDAHILKGIGLSQTGQPDAATDSFQRAITLDPNSAKAQYNLAVHLYAQGRKTEALQAARAAANLDASHSTARQLISTIETELAGPSTVGMPNPNDPLAAPPQTPSVPPIEGPKPFAPPPPVGQVPPGPQNPYMKEAYQGPIHSIPFVERLGQTWVYIGWGIAVISLSAFIFTLALYYPAISSWASSGSSDPKALSDKLEHLQGVTILQILSWTGILGILTWSIMDLVDRRGNFIWLVPLVILSCCCGFGWLILPIYILAGRNK